MSCLTSACFFQLLDLQNHVAEVKRASLGKADVFHVDHIAGRLNQVVEHVVASDTSSAVKVQQVTVCTSQPCVHFKHECDDILVCLWIDCLD